MVQNYSRANFVAPTESLKGTDHLEDVAIGGYY
jgi:hypothetical protein